MNERLDDIAATVDVALPRTARLAVIGSASFFHPDSKLACIAIAKRLAGFSSVAVITGGRMGVGETVGRTVHQWRVTNDRESHIYHLLPIGSSPIDYGATIFCGRNMVERREVLGRVAQLYLAIEGGPGTEYEAEVALSKGATVVPVGRSGGYSRKLYDDMPIPHGLSAEDWTTLGADGVSLNELARAVESIMSVFLVDGNWPRDRRRTQP